VINIICSDHQPHDDDAKLAPFPASEPGISGLETLLPLTLRLVDEKVIDLSRAIALLTQEPARLLGLLDSGQGGTLAVGSRADICIFDPEQFWTLTPETINSEGINTPFMGWDLKGRVTHTLMAGKVTYGNLHHTHD
jgi:dihydroorotase